MNDKPGLCLIEAKPDKAKPLMWILGEWLIKLGAYQIKPSDAMIHKELFSLRFDLTNRNE